MKFDKLVKILHNKTVERKLFYEFLIKLVKISNKKQPDKE